jgi:hypothetical protein
LHNASQTICKIGNKPPPTLNEHPIFNSITATHVTEAAELSAGDAEKGERLKAKGIGSEGENREWGNFRAPDIERKNFSGAPYV